MKILYLIRQNPEPTWKEILEEHKKSNDVTIVDIRENKNYDEIVDLITSNDKIISV